MHSIQMQNMKSPSMQCNVLPTYAKAI